MTTIKPLPNSKPKNPVYYDEVVQMYEGAKVKAKTDHNPADALEELQKQLKNKKATKIRLIAREEAIEFKKKGVGKSAPLKSVPYSAVKSFYQFSTSPAFVVLGVQGNNIIKQYVILSAPSVDKANKLTEVLQSAQWATKNNLKNPIPAAVLTDSVLAKEASRISNSPRNSSRSSSSPRRQPRTPSPSSHHTPIRRNSRSTSSSSSSSSKSSSSCSKKRRASSATSSKVGTSGRFTSTHSHSPSPQRNPKRTASVSIATTIEIPIARNSHSFNQFQWQNKDDTTGFTEDRSYFIYYNPPKKGRNERKHKSLARDRQIIYCNLNDSSSPDNEYETQSGFYVMSNKKPKVTKARKPKNSSASADTRISSRIYYFRKNDSSSSSSSNSSSESEDETYVVQRISRSSKFMSRRSRRSPHSLIRSPPRGRRSYSNSSSSSSGSSSSSRRSSSSFSSTRMRSYSRKKRNSNDVSIVYCLSENHKAY